MVSVAIGGHANRVSGINIRFDKNIDGKKTF